MSEMMQDGDLVMICTDGGQEQRFIVSVSADADSDFIKIYDLKNIDLNGIPFTIQMQIVKNLK